MATKKDHPKIAPDAIERFRAMHVVVGKQQTATPGHIMKRLRKRAELDENDTSRDAEFEALSPIEKLREVSAWELGYASWADQFMTWAKECGIKVEGEG